AGVAVEHALVGALETDVGELLGGGHRIVDAAVHAPAADRVVYVGGGARPQHPSFFVGAGDALMPPIGRVIRNIVVAALAVDALQAALHALRAHRLLVRFVLRHRKHAAPDAGRPVTFDLEQVEPLIGIEEVVPRAEAPVGYQEIEGGADLD